MSPGYTMELPTYVTSWVLKRTGERRYACTLCSKDDRGGIDGLRYHLGSRPHINKVMQQAALHCTLCNLQCKYPSVYNTHIKSKAHLQKENPQPKAIVEYKCEDCRVVFQSNKDKIRHLATKKHAKLAGKTDEVVFSYSKV